LANSLSAGKKAKCFWGTEKNCKLKFENELLSEKSYVALWTLKMQPADH
jgi:hypothetical protein